MSHITYKVELKINKSNDEYGILRIRKTKNRVKSYVSLKEKVKVDDWNDKEHGLKLKKDNASEVKRIKKLIDDKIKELETAEEKAELVVSDKEPKKEISMSFLNYVEKQVNRLRDKSPGTSKKRRTIQNLLKEYIEKDNKKDLLVSEITKDFVMDLEAYLLGKVGHNTAKTYVRTFRTIYNQAMNSDEFGDFVIKDPFREFEYKLQDTEEKSLSLEEVEMLEDFVFEKNNNLNTIRDLFVFQIYAGGLRISDLKTLKWNNISEDEINLWQYKTKGRHFIYLNEKLRKILFKFMTENEEEIKSLDELYYVADVSMNNPIVFRNFNDYVENGNKFFNYDNDYEMYELDFLRQTNLSTIINYGSKEEKEAYRFRELELKADCLKSYQEKAADIILEAKKQQEIDIINEYAEKHRTDFIFPFLDKNEFEKIDFNKSNVSINYKLYSKLETASAVYNKQLKRLQKKVFGEGFRIPITSHLARHTMITILLSKGIDLYTAQRILGHKSVVITEKYVSNSHHKDQIKKAKLF